MFNLLCITESDKCFLEVDLADNYYFNMMLKEKHQIKPKLHWLDWNQN
jgi:hypothetical protein